jgi:hypothetical protein
MVNSKGYTKHQLGFLDNLVAIAQVEYSPEEGINRFAEWEWKGRTLPFESVGAAPPTTGNQTTPTSMLQEE